jgi:PAS domain S-box-containing protein
VIAANFEGRSEEFEFRFRRPDGSEIPVLAGTAPLRDEKGRINGSLGMFSDLTARKASEQALARSGLEAAEAASRLAQQVAELNALYDSAPIGLAFFDREYRYVRINSELAGINGVAPEEHAGRTLREIVPVNAPQVEPVIDRVFATGKPVRDLEVIGETPQQPGVERHWLTGFYPVFDEDGTVVAVGVWVVEISERKAAEQREVLLAREVDHRAKNLLAVVQSIVTLTPVAGDGGDLKTSVVGRIQALARAHVLLSDSRWDGVDLGALIDEELAPFASKSRRRIHTGGPSLKLRPAAAQSLALVLHELATNAAKYGALSVGTGELRVEWRRDQDDKGNWLIVEWTESGGPAVDAPETLSFGSNIIRASVERQLRGKVVKDWRPEGLFCTLRIPSAEAVPGGES